jgi:serine/threonine protein kinase
VYRAYDAPRPRRRAQILPDIMAQTPTRSPASSARPGRRRLNHPHIVTIYSTEEHTGVRFLTMEVVEGQTLDRLIPAGGIALDRFFDIAIALAERAGGGAPEADHPPRPQAVERDGDRRWAG